MEINFEKFNFKSTGILLRSVLSVLLAVLIVFSSFAVSPIAFEAKAATVTDGNVTSGNVTVNKPGDVDCDDEITSFDARLARRAAVRLEEVSNDLADVDMDGYITAADARLILRMAVGLETMPKVETLIEVKKPENVQNKNDFVVLDLEVSGNELTVNVKGTAASEFLSGDLVLTYDSSLLSFSAMELGEKIKSEFDANNIAYAKATENGKIKVSYYAIEKLMLAANDTILTLKFDILSNATTTLGLSGKIFVEDGRYLFENSVVYTDNSTTPDEPTTDPDEPTVHTHSFSRTVIIEPGCETIGEQEFTCSCGEIYRGIILPTGHIDDDADGVCDVCGEYEENEEDKDSVTNEENDNSLFGKIRAFFRRIIEFFKNLFTF